MLRTMLVIIIFSDFQIVISQDRNDTLLTCYICMEYEYTVKQKCDEDKPNLQTCVFTKDLINWVDVKEKLDSEVSFKCLLLYFKELESDDVKSLRGCVAEYEEYHVCDNLKPIVKWEEQISCVLCEEKLCNIGLTFDEDGSISNDLFGAFYFLILIHMLFNSVINR